MYRDFGNAQSKVDQAQAKVNSIQNSLNDLNKQISEYAIYVVYNPLLTYMSVAGVNTPGRLTRNGGRCPAFIRRRPVSKHLSSQPQSSWMLRRP